MDNLVNDEKIIDGAREVPFAYKWLNDIDKVDYRIIANTYQQFLQNNILELKDYLKNKTIAVVGNSPCELNLSKGSEIDNHDIVIRFNNFIVNNEFKKDYGSKTNIWCVTPTLESLKLRNNIGNFDFVLMPLSNRYISDYRFEWLKNNSIAGVKICLFPVSKILNIYDMRVVSLGLLTILYLINDCDCIKKVDIYGFSLGEQINGVKHYFSGDPSSGKLLKFHDWMREALFLNQMISEGYINHE